METKTSNLGRPKLPEHERQKYQRVALYPETHALAKKLAETDKKNLIDWLDELVRTANDSRNKPVAAEHKKKKFPFFNN